MLREAGANIEAGSAPAFEAFEASTGSRADFRSRQEARPHWQSIDRALRTIASRRAALDAEEARWLREAEKCQIWRPLGMVSALDYMERVLGYAPRSALERLRVARALGALPQLTAALARGELPFSAIRELTRVATPATEAAWHAAAVGKNLRQIEDLVADHKPGDRPEDPGDPEARTHVVRFELSAETFAQLRQARQALDNERGTSLSDDEMVAALCSAVLDGAPASEPTGRAKFQIALTVCARCRQGWQEGAGAKIAISPAAVERATCDAQHVGSLDGPGPERAYQDVPPSVVRFVWRRDGGRCRIPGCRSSRGLEIHHLTHRADGGRHDPLNLILSCAACHSAHHRGLLHISGTSDQLEVARYRTPHATPAPPVPVRSDGSLVRDAEVTDRCVNSTTAAGVPVRSGGGLVRDAEVTDRGGSTATGSARATRGTHMAAPTWAPSKLDVAAPTWAPSKLDVAVIRAQAKTSLMGVGWKPAIASAAVAAAHAALGSEATLAALIVEALRRCPRPTG